VAVGLLLLAACAEDEVGPGGGAEGYTIWIAQTASGSVRQAITGTPIADALVSFQAGFADTALFTLRSGRTNLEGTFSFVAAEQTGQPGDFWWFLVPDDDPRQVIVRVQVWKDGFLPAARKETLTRVPSREAPDEDYPGQYQLSLNVVMTPADQAELERPPGVRESIPLEPPRALSPSFFAW
jgi:hypothetical protein